MRAFVLFYFTRYYLRDKKYDMVGVIRTLEIDDQFDFHVSLNG